MDQNALASTIMEGDPFWKNSCNGNEDEAAKGWTRRRRLAAVRQSDTCWRIEEPNASEKKNLAEACGCKIEYIEDLLYVRADTHAYGMYMRILRKQAIEGSLLCLQKNTGHN